MQTYLSAQSLFLKLNFASNSSNTTKCRYETFFVLLNFTGFLRFVIMIMKMMNCFCGMVDRRKVYSLISSRDHCQRSSPSGISVAPRAGSEPEFKLSWMKLRSSDNRYTTAPNILSGIVLASKCLVIARPRSIFWHFL